MHVTKHVTKKGMLLAGMLPGILKPLVTSQHMSTAGTVPAGILTASMSEAGRCLACSSNKQHMDELVSLNIQIPMAVANLIDRGMLM